MWDTVKKSSDSFWIPRGSYIATDGEIKTIVTVNDFYTEDVFLNNAKAVQHLENLANENGWIFRGGNYMPPGSDLHAEDHFIDIVKGLPDIEKDSIVTGGVSESICSSCQGLGQQLGQRAGKELLVRLSDGIRVVFAAGR